MKFKTIVVIIVITLVVVFSLQNAEATDVKFFNLKISVSRVLIILGSFSIGVLVGILISLKKRFLTPRKK